jgi:Flp pilus assembly protein TadG
MKEGRKISFSNKGIAVIILALGVLVLMLIFASLGIDIAYMYNVKNQLQVAADASALAGADVLDSNTSDNTSTAFLQTPARQAAWSIACKNKAAGSAVFLVTNSSLDCNAPPSGLNESNAAAGDIVLGHWSSTPLPCPSTGSTDNFCPGNGTTGLRINAVKVVARRTAGSPGGPVRIFWGKVLGLIASDWSHMSAASQAIAYRAVMKPTLPIAIDQDATCGEVISCPGPMTTTFNPDGSDSGAWTTFYFSPAASTIRDFIKNPGNDPNVCESPNPVQLNNGAVASALQELDGDIKNLFGGYPFDATIVQVDNPGCKFNQSRAVLGIVEITITDVVATGGNKHISATINACYPCDQVPLGKTAKLVR